MKKLTLLVFFLITLFPLSAQNNYSRVFGQVTAAEMAESEKLVSLDPDAVVIHDLGKYWFSLEDEGSVSKLYFFREGTEKIKILSTAGLEERGTFEIAFYSDPSVSDKLNIEGYTYSIEADGRFSKTPVTNINIVDEKINDKWSVRKIAFPNAKPGSIVEIKYRLRTRNNVMPPWAFQRDIPVLYSELEYRAPIHYNYSYLLKGASHFDVSERRVESTQGSGAGYSTTTTDEIIYTFGIKNLKAFEDTQFLPTTIDYKTALYFQLESARNLNNGSVTTYISTWNNMATQFDKDDNLGKYIRSVEKSSKKILPDIISGTESTLEKVKAISEYVKSSYSWDRKRSKYSSQNAGSFMKNKTGNGADINLFLIGLLKGAGIEAIPVVVSTNDNGKIYKKYPFSIFFNYVVGMVTVDGKNYFLDATDPFARFDELPRWCVDVEGLAVIPKTEKWVVLSQPQTSVEDTQIIINLDSAKETVYVEARKSMSGYPATSNRKAFNKSEDNLRKLNRLSDNATLIDVSAENYEDIYKPFIMNSSYEVPMEIIDGKIFLNPLAGFAPEENPFNQKFRSWPVYLYYRSMDSYSATINIPDGYEIEHLPEAKSADNNAGTILYNIGESNGVISIQASFLLKKAEYSPMEYNSLKNTYGDMISTFSENIILRKKAGI